MANYRRNEVVKVNRGHLEMLAESLDCLAKSAERGEMNPAWLSPVTVPEAIKNVAKALRNTAGKDKSPKGDA